MSKPQHVVILVLASILTAGCTGFVATQGLDARAPPPCEEGSPEPPWLVVDEVEGLSTYRWDVGEGSYERIAHAPQLSKPLLAHGRLYAIAEESLVVVNETLAPTAEEPVKRAKTLAASEEGLLLAANGSIVSLSPDLERQDRLGAEELIGVDVRKNVHAIHAEAGTAWMLDNTVQPVWIVRASVEDPANISVDARHQMETLGGHLPFHWLDHEEGLWNVVSTSSSSEPAWRSQTVHRFDDTDVRELGSEQTWFSEESSQEEGLRIEAISPETHPWALVQRQGDVGLGTVHLEGGELVASNLSLLASGDHDQRYASALGLGGDHAIAVVDREVNLLDLQEDCLIDRVELASRVLGVELTSSQDVAPG